MAIEHGLRRRVGGARDLEQLGLGEVLLGPDRHQERRVALDSVVRASARSLWSVALPLIVADA